MTDQILFYLRDEEYGWLSNFWRAREVVGHVVYATNEHFYQAQKAKDSNDADWIRLAPKPFFAMKMGRSLREHEIRPDWERIKFGVMKEGLWAKFSQNADLARKLLETRDASIHENSATDMVWGIKGEDMLGKLLMEVREELKISRWKPWTEPVIVRSDEATQEKVT